MLRAVDQQRAVGATFAEGEIVDGKHTGVARSGIVIWRVRRSRVSGLVGMACRWLWRAPGSPPRANPTDCNVVVKRSVRWAAGASRPGKGSENVLAAQTGL